MIWPVFVTSLGLCPGGVAFRLGRGPSVVPAGLYAAFHQRRVAASHFADADDVHRQSAWRVEGQYYTERRWSYCRLRCWGLRTSLTPTTSSAIGLASAGGGVPARPRVWRTAGGLLRRRGAGVALGMVIMVVFGLQLTPAEACLAPWSLCSFWALDVVGWG